MVFAIFSGGEFNNVKIQPYDFLICADRGYDYAMRLNLTPNYVLGDFDSLNYVPKNAEVVNREKDFSDTELCLKKAIEKGAKQIDIYFALGGRIDHELFNIQLLLLAKKHGVNARIIARDCVVELLSPLDNGKKISVEVGKTVSLVPFSNTVHIISLEGLKYNFNGEIVKGETKTLSNVAISDKIAVNILSGEVLLVYFY